MTDPATAFTKRTCAKCGEAALVEDSDRPYFCPTCSAEGVAVGDEPGERTVSRFWSESRSSAGALTTQAFSALDDVFNPAAARAKEALKADHERQLPIPSPGDDALRTGSLVIRVPKADVPEDN